MKNCSSNVDRDKFDRIINSMRFQGLTYLMNMDYADLNPEEVNKECKKLAVELKILSGRLMSIAFDETGVPHGREEKR